MEDLGETAREHDENGSSEDRHPRNPLGCAIVSPIVEKTTDLPSDGPCFDDCYTTLLHNSDHDLGSSSGKRSGKRTGGCYCVLIQEPLPPLIAIIVSGEPGG